MKNIIIGVLFLVAFISIIHFGMNRIEKINNGEIKQISESEMK